MERLPHTLKALNETFSSKEMMKKPKTAVKPAPCVYPGQHVSYRISTQVNLLCMVLTRGCVCSPRVPLLAFHLHTREEKRNLLNPLKTS